MNEITEYRKASAEALNLMGEVPYYIEDHNNDFTLWQPDIDANQREMIEDWLIKQGCETYCSIHRTSLTKTVQYDYRIVNDETDNRAIKISQESKSMSFMKVFMKYIKTKKDEWT